MSAQFLSRFTPSLMDAETLEAIFVQREAVAQQLVDSIRESALTKAKHHTLLVGPRGMGKTHLVSLVYHRVAAMEDLRGKLAVAWLHEEEYGVSSFLDFLLRVIRALREREPSAIPEADVEALYDLSPKMAEARATALLESALGGRTLLVITENLDDTFAGLGAEGQKRLRSYVQEQRSWTILATTQSLFNGVKLQTSPFYGFFSPVLLEQLSLEDAIELLAKIATRHGDDDLAAFIRTPRGRARVRALHHLAGGNPRVYVILSQFLTRESLDELVGLFLQAMDDLTPYYQARMQWLSGQQRKIVSLLVERRGAVPVKEVAQRSHVSQQTVSSQLRTLREMGYVESRTEGRESYYELREPLMRYALEVKRQRAEPVRFIVELLRIWYSRDELRERLSQLGDGLVLDRAYCELALAELDRESDDPKIATCLADLARSVQTGEWLSALDTSEELTQLRGSALDWAVHSQLLVRLERRDEARAALDRGLQAEPESAEAQLIVTWASLGANHIEAAHSAAETATRLRPDSGMYWTVLATIELVRGDNAAALAALDHAVLAGGASDILPQYVRPVARQYALLLIGGGRWEEGLRALEQQPVWPDDPQAMASLTAEIVNAIPPDVGHVSIVAALLQLYGTRSKALVLGAMMFWRGAELARTNLGSLRAWSALCHAAVEQLTDTNITKELRPFLYLLAVAVEYAEVGDERILLRLPAEARDLVEPFHQRTAGPSPP